ncbi:MAG: BlaI/MecI/CopY family transcriptional regulator [Actinobacteria bacterium]|nr:BlaI/MecI/CopY family transcriptional regulator [Actinomycetota bacterium]
MAKAGTGELEAAVMDVLWSSSGWMTAGEVHDRLSSDRHLAYNTVMTILVRLWNKGRVHRQRDGRAFAYQARVSREEWAATRMDEVLDEVDDRPAVLNLLLAKMTRADRDQLRRLLSERSPRTKPGRAR